MSCSFSTTPARKAHTRARACALAAGLALAAAATAADTQQNNNLRIQQRPQNTTLQASRIAMLRTNQAHLVQSQNFLGHPGPPGSTEIQAHNGNVVRRAADGQVIDVRNPRTGMVIHHGLDGSRHVSVQGADHSRVYATTRGLSYVQHPYVFNGQVYDHRTFVVQGHLAHQLYRPYTWGGQTLDVYATTRFYGPDFYRMVAARSQKPFTFQWTYLTNTPDWYGYYRGYFVPESSYNSAAMWLTDYVLAASLAVSYRVEPPTSPAPSSNSPSSAPSSGTSGASSAPADAGPTVTPQVKQMLAQEVGRQVNQEAAEAQANAQNRPIQGAASGVVQELSDNQDHVFVANADLDLVDQNGRRCMISEGDVVNVRTAVDQSSSTAMAVVLASKGFGECERAAVVPIPVSELQEMQNHMRAAIDEGLANSAPGRKAQATTPAFAAAPPRPDANAVSEIETQQKIAAAEG